MADQETPAEVAENESATDARKTLSVFGYNADMDFRKLALEAEYHSRGFRLVSKEDLRGIPHVIIGLVYREGFPRNGAVGDYVSVEAVVADNDTLNTSPVQNMIDGPAKVFGNEPVVYNDSGTGIRRTMTEWLHSLGVIDVGKARKDENAFDKPYQFWDKGEEMATQGIRALPDGRPLRWLALRGLRDSEYEWQGKPATTYYLG